MLKEKPLISVAMTTYNGEKFLREQLDSIFAQTYKNTVYGTR
jgi:glycosyltransferase involved in cell wall biosynthesis